MVTNYFDQGTFHTAGPIGLVHRTRKSLIYPKAVRTVEGHTITYNEYLLTHEPPCTVCEVITFNDHKQL